MRNLQICCGTSSASDYRQICTGRNLVSNFPPYFSGQYPWLVTYDSECRLDTDQIFCTIPISPIQYHHYHCRIPQLMGRYIWGCFHGWLIMSKYPDNLDFCLWNLVTLKFFRLPRLKLKSFGKDDKQREFGDDIGCCCLSSPPSNPDSVVILTQISKPIIVFCLLRNKRRKWTEMSYANHIRKISNHEDDLIDDMALSNGKVFASTRHGNFVQIDILVNHKSKKKEVFISLLPFGIVPQSFPDYVFYYHLSGCDTELFLIVESLKNFQYKEIQSIYLFRLDFSTMTWREVKNVKDRVFFLDEFTQPQICCPAIESEAGNYIHIIRDSCKLYSYNMEDKTMSLSFLPCPNLPPGPRPCHLSLWVMPESRLLGDHGEGKCSIDTKKDQAKEEEEIVVRSVISSDVDIIMNEQLGERMEACLVNMPFHILELIAEHCVAVDYLNFRATCKQCLLAAPLKQWSTETALGRLRTHSLVSPWLMICDKDRGILTFIDPKFGDKYFMTTIPESIGDAVICYSKYGWLLIFKRFYCLVFFNPFTRAIVELPPLAPPYSSYFSSLCFSAPPTSPDCIVCGFAEDFDRNFYITSPGATSVWRIIGINPDIQPNLSSNNSTAFCGRNLYALCKDGELGILRIGTRCSWEILIAEPPRASCISCAQRFLVECCDDLLSIFVDEFGEWVEVFKLNHSSLQWEKVDGLGKHMIYVCGTTSFSVVAKSPGMENNIYFPRFHDGNIICYSLSTCNYHTVGYKGKGQQEFTNFLNTKEPLSCVWIEPSWAS